MVLILMAGLAGLRPRAVFGAYNIPALRLYQHVGFVKIADEAPYYLMEWRARG